MCIVGGPGPKLIVSPAILYEMDTLNLTCEVPMGTTSGCYFSCVGKEDASYAAPDCRYSPKAYDILKLSGQNSPAEVEMRCSYNEKISGALVHSDPSAVTVQSKFLFPVRASPTQHQKRDFDTMIV